MLAAPWLPALQRMAWCQSAPRDHSIMVPPVGEVEVTSKIISKIVRLRHPFCGRRPPSRHRVSGSCVVDREVVSEPRCSA